MTSPAANLFFPFELYVRCRRWHHSGPLGWEWPAECPADGCTEPGELLRKLRVRAKVT